MTLLDGVTVGGHRISDQDQILNLIESSRHLLALVKRGEFALDKETFGELQGIVARNEALEWGHFRGEGTETRLTPNVTLGAGSFYTPMATIAGAPELNHLFNQGIEALRDHAATPFEQATAFFLFGALQQFFFDGNKRTSRLMLNGVLMTAGIDAISVPAARAKEFNEKMVQFYVSRDASEFLQFLVTCHPDFSAADP